MLFLLFSFISAYAEILTPSTNTDLTTASEFKILFEQVKSLGEYKKEEVQPKVLSRGEQLIEEAKAKNRALIAKKIADEKKQDKLEGIEALKASVDKAHEEWNLEIQKARAQWQKEQDQFLGRIKTYQENTFKIPVKEIKIVEKQLIEKLPEVFVVQKSFEIPIKDQMNRPTCAAFAGIRAIETLIAQSTNQTKDLSEQYLYWSSKPQCQSSPCTIKGSWVTNGFDYSIHQSKLDIPEEISCSYIPESLSNNETQVPLTKDCYQGKAKIIDYKTVESISDLYLNLKKNQPAIIATKLTENFYVNKGLVLVSESEKKFGLPLNGHSQGHALLAIGFIEYPEKVKSVEGNYCILVANSWGRGFGVGGYSCISENYLKKFRIAAPFIIINKIQI